MAKKEISEVKQEEAPVEKTTDTDVKDESCTGATPRLTAVTHILYLSHQYAPGDTLPANDSQMTEAWLAAGTAVWKGATGDSERAVQEDADGDL